MTVCIEIFQPLLSAWTLGAIWLHALSRLGAGLTYQSHIMDLNPTLHGHGPFYLLVLFGLDFVS